MENTEASWFEKNPKKTVIVILLLSLFILLFIAEKIFENKIGIKNNSHMRYVYVKEMLPNTNTIEESFRLDDTFVKLQSDENGLVLPSKVYEKPDFSIFFMGSSTTLCANLEPEKRFSYFTGKLLEKKLEKKINSYNGAAGSTTTFNGINLLVNKIIPYNPKYLIFMYNSPDLGRLLKSEKSYWENNYKTVDFSLFLLLRGIKNSLFPNLYYVIKTKIDLGTMIGNTLSYFTPSKNVVSSLEHPDFNKLETIYRKNLEAIISLCKIYNIVPVIMTEPYSELAIQDNALGGKHRDVNKFMFYQNKFNEVIRDVASRSNAILIDLDKEITGSVELFQGKFHLSEKGSIRVSNIIAMELYKAEKGNLK